MRFTLAFLVLGAGVSYLAVSLGGVWHAFHWLSLSFFALSAAYAGIGPVVFGKRADGTLPIWSKIVHFPYRVYAGAMWNLICLVGRESAADRVSDDLFVGRRVRPKELPEGAVNCVDLTCEFEDPKRIRDGTNYICLPTLDAGVPSRDAIDSAIDRLRPGPTFVHCAQGHGRTGLFALVLLARRGRIGSFEEGMALVAEARPGIRLHKNQEEFVRRYVAGQGTGRSRKGTRRNIASTETAEQRD
ncbi:hypothetical protein JW916_08695 [Candidatus Sumerlaeota bacterium]|nr:hypothetical protein [Candidatus Sumerlaeota bacterium]